MTATLSAIRTINKLVGLCVILAYGVGVGVGVRSNVITRSVTTPSCTLTSRLTRGGGLNGVPETVTTSSYSPGGTPSIKKCPRASTTGGLRLTGTSPAFINLTNVCAPGGNDPFSNFT